MARKAPAPIQQPARPGVGEKIAALDTADYLEARAAGASFRRALAKVPGVEPGCNDRTG